MIKTKYEIIEISNAEITVDVSLLEKMDELFFNATEMAKKYDKRPVDWLDSKQAKDYIAVILKVENSHFENLVKTTQGGKFKGTWLSKKLALPFARWLDVEFEYRLDKWIQAKVEEEKNRKVERLESKTGYAPLTKAVNDAHENPMFYHFANEADLINKLVTGLSAKKFKELHGVESVRDALCAADIQKLNKLQTQDTALIELGFDYDQRKALLSSYLNKNLAA